MHGWEAYVSTDVGLSSEFGLPLRTTSVPSTPEPDLENLTEIADRNLGFGLGFFKNRNRNFG